LADILVLAPLLPVVEETVRANGLTTARAWEQGALPDVATVRAGVRALATTYTSPVSAALIESLPRLEIISVFGVGYDSIDLRAAAARGIVVTNTPDVLTEEVADATLGLLLCTVRELPQAERFVRDGRWVNGPYPLTSSLREKKVGIFGLGRIGKAVASRCEAFGLSIAYHGRKPQDVPYRYYGTLVDLARNVDILIVTAPATPDTRGAIDTGVLTALGPEGVLINVARGSIVDEPALIQALSSRTIYAAGLDVFATEPRVPDALLALDRVVVLPHVGSASRATRNAMGLLVAENLISWFAGKGPVTPVAETPARTARSTP
jgi:lactate dehydrogenase-like 2-hydroxyacid dehydrogenase